MTGDEAGSETTAVPTEEFWEGFYQERDRVWSGNPNVMLVREVTALAPGTALDLGSGEGADAVWLAEQGWRVTAVDVSETALGRGAGHAAGRGVADRITWQQHDLAVSFPVGTFDLVSAQYFHSPVEQPGARDHVLRRAAAAVAPGGVLLVVGHAGPPSWDPHTHADRHFPTPDDVLGVVSAVPGPWVVVVNEEFERAMTGPDGQPGQVVDNALLVRRGTGA